MHLFNPFADKHTETFIEVVTHTDENEKQWQEGLFPHHLRIL